MLHMNTTISFTYQYSNGSTPCTHEAVLRFPTGITGELGCVVYTFSGSTSACNGLIFIARDTALTEATEYLKLDVNYSGAYTGQSLDNNSWSYTKNNSIDSVTAQQETARSITNLYNGLYGTSLTNAQVYDELKRLYGNYESFSYVNISGRMCPKAVGGSAYEFRNKPSVCTFGQSCNSSWVSSNITETWRPPFYEDVTIDSEMVETIGNNINKWTAYMIFQRPPINEKLIFDVYVDGVIGEKGPNIWVKWRNYNTDSELAPELIKPHIWVWAWGQPGTQAVVVDGVAIPNDADFKYNTKFEWTGQYFSDYLGQANSLTEEYSSINKVVYFGLDGIPDYLQYFLRFDYTIADPDPGENPNIWGPCFIVKIPYNYEGAAYVEVNEIPNSANSTLYDTEVNIIGGTPPDDPADDDPSSPDLTDPDGDPSGVGPYDPDYGVPDLTGYEANGFDGSAVLTKTYSMSGSTLTNVGTKLWSQSYLDVMKIQNNPIENIISCKWYPMAITGTNTEIKVGDVNFGIYGDSIGTMYTKTIGNFTYTVDNSRPGYLSCSPYTTIKMHLPYCGTVQLDATEILNRKVTVKYIVDLVTGDCLAIVTLDKSVPYMEISGKMGVDIPLTGSNRVQTELAAASRSISAAIGAAGHLVGGDVLGAANEATGIMSMMGMDYSTQRTQTHSSACASYMSRAIYVEIRRPNLDKSNGYNSRHGRPFHKFVKLSSLKGFVQIDTRTTINVAMTAEENRMLEEIMTTGFYM